MAKLLLLSSLVMSIWLPIRQARRSTPQPALAGTIRNLAFFNVFYVFALLYIFPRLPH